MLDGRKLWLGSGIAMLAIMMVSSASMVTAIPALGAPCPNAALRNAASAGLPDCRAFELVSPSDKGGFAAYPPPSQPTLAQASPSGTEFAYLTFSAFPGALGNTALNAAHVGTRKTDGWQTVEWTPEVPRAEVLKAFQADYVFSEDLSEAVLQVPLMLLTPKATPDVENLYLRHPEGQYTLINNAPPAISAEALCGPGLLWICFQFEDISAYAGSSSDMRHVLFESTSQLVSSAPPTETEALYESFNGHVLLTGILPDGSAASSSTAGSGSSVFYRSVEPAADGRVEHAVSRDGSRVVFQAPADEGGPDAEQSGQTEVFDRIGGSETVELSAPAPGATPKITTPEPAMFWDASEDGSRVFFTSSAELTTESNTGSANNGNDLYEYNLQSRVLKDLTIDKNPTDESTGAMVQGVAGVSSDGSDVYFVAAGQLVEGKGVDGEPNLYLVHNGGSPRFIATLSSADVSDWTQIGSSMQSYVTPDGSHLEFRTRAHLMSANFPAGYDNRDQETGELDSEIYEYEAGENEEASRLICASCDPSGWRPVSDAFTSGSTAFKRSRVVSNNGARVFYVARTTAAPAVAKVFEYEQAGEGGCANPLGCQYLLSGAEGTEDELFLDAGASGADVFFATANQLGPGDTDNLRDIYDARVDGGTSLPRTEPVCVKECRVPTMPVVVAPAIVGATSGPSANTKTDQRHTQKQSPRCKKRYKLRHKKCVRHKARGKAKGRNRGGVR